MDSSGLQQAGGGIPPQVLGNALRAQKTPEIAAPDMASSRFPRLAQHPFKVADQSALANAVGGSEFYPATGEDANPFPGHATVGIRDPAIRDDPARLMATLEGELLHNMPLVDEDFRSMREMFGETLTEEQTATDDQAFEIDRMLSADAGHEPRSREQFMDVSRLDAYIRGSMAPDERAEFRRSFTPQQERLLDQIRLYLQGTSGGPSFRSFAGGS
jgi:hypothetical protein|tara:strand:+ start:580 stop:1227 length:648 start_codon:yes stop_codon:yes gene_type:complete